MTTARIHRGTLLIAGALLLLLLPVFAFAFNPSSTSSEPEQPDVAGASTLEPTEIPPLPTPTPAVPLATPPPAEGAGGAVEVPIHLTDEERATIQPNELGRIPVLMYHAFTQNEAYLDEWTVTTDQFRAHLQWLYDHDFYITPLADLINNEISVPAGKRPVVLTFDDSSSGQFRLLKNADGTVYPDLLTAVGVMEAFYAEHPDFGRGGLFAVIPTNCFSDPAEVVTCEERLAWLANNGYEIANHTWWHENLHTVSDDLFRQQVGQTKIWIDERVKVRAANLSNVLILPYGEWPRNDGQVNMLYNGFVYDGQEIVMGGIVEVAGGFSPSPSSGEWSRRHINRINTDPRNFWYWMNQIETGEATMYVSDGNPETVTIPNQLAGDIAYMWNAEWASAYGMQVIRYDLPES